jgi:hypothetical protein
MSKVMKWMFIKKFENTTQIYISLGSIPNLEVYLQVFDKNLNKKYITKNYTIYNP